MSFLLEGVTAPPYVAMPLSYILIDGFPETTSKTIFVLNPNPFAISHLPPSASVEKWPNSISIQGHSI
jgi:hypothetical protein